MGDRARRGGPGANATMHPLRSSGPSITLAARHAKRCILELDCQIDQGKREQASLALDCVWMYACVRNKGGTR